MSRSEEWSAFWRAYKSGGHSERPSLFRENEYPGTGISIDLIFRAVVRMCDRFREMPRSDRIMFSHIRFYISGNRIPDPAEYLMQQQDGDFRGWQNRMEEAAGDYCVVFNRLESAFESDVYRIYEFLRPLVDEFGLPARKSEVTLFAGRYTKTPFGIHNDDELNFFWPLIGPKRLRFWTPEYARDNPAMARLVDYDDYVSQSMLLEAQAGDMLAWPGSWWHIAEGGDEFSASLTIPLEWYASSEKIDSAELMKRMAKVLVRSAAAHAGSTLVPLRSLEDTSEALPEIISDVGRLFSQVRPEEIMDLLTEDWLRRSTTGGLDVAGPVRNEVVDLEKSRMTLSRHAGPVRWARLSRGRICLASGGRAVRLPYSQAVIEIIREVNTSKPFSIGSLAERVSAKCGDTSPVAVTKFAVTILSKIGALEAANEFSDGAKTRQ